jgi:hypothetical protein
MSITDGFETWAWSLLQIRHIRRGSTVANGTVAQLRNPIFREQLVKCQNHDPFRKHHGIPLLQPDFGLEVGLLAINYVAVNLIAIGTHDYREVRRIEFAGASWKIMSDDQARALVETLGLVHLRRGEREVRALDMVDRKRPVRGRLC